MQKKRKVLTGILKFEKQRLLKKRQRLVKELREINERLSELDNI